MGSPFIPRRSWLWVTLVLILLCAYLIQDVDAKSKAAKAIKGAAKAYTAHRAARSAMSIWRIAFFIFAAIIAVISVGAIIFYIKRRFFSSGSEGFGLLREEH